MKFSLLLCTTYLNALDKKAADGLVANQVLDEAVKVRSANQSFVRACAVHVGENDVLHLKE